MHSFCDFCAHTPVDVAVDRIFLCKEWESICIPQLEHYLDQHILPAIVNPLYKLLSIAFHFLIIVVPIDIHDLLYSMYSFFETLIKIVHNACSINTQHVGEFNAS